MNNSYKLDILDVKPVNDFKCICVIEADIEVDFAPPLDYEEKLPDLQKKTSSVNYEDS